MLGVTRIVHFHLSLFFHCNSSRIYVLLYGLHESSLRSFSSPPAWQLCLQHPLCKFTISPQHMTQTPLTSPLTFFLITSFLPPIQALFMGRSILGALTHQAQIFRDHCTHTQWKPSFSNLWCPSRVPLCSWIFLLLNQ